MKLAVRTDKSKGAMARAGQKYAADLDASAHWATDYASRLAQRALRSKMASVGLGRLGNAVGQTSSLQKRQFGNNPYGVLYAKGGDESLAGGALDAYRRGVTIRANNGKWLAFPTSAIPQRVSRYRITPERYLAGGLASRYGKLVFRPVKPDLALLVIRNATLTAKGRVRVPGKRKLRSSVKVKEVVAFVLIKETRRAQRFDRDREVAPYAAMVPQLMGEDMARRQRR